MQYIKVILSPGHRKREDISNWRLSTGEYIWIGEDTATFDPTAEIGDIGPNDPQPPSEYTWAVCTQEEIDELAGIAYNIREEQRVDLIQKGMVDCIRAIVKIYQVGQSKGVWAIDDFPSELVAAFQNWIAIINAKDSDSAEPPT